MERGFACFWLHLLLLAIVFEDGYSIKCYVCSTLNDPNCHDPIASKMNPSECSSDLASVTLQRFRSLPGVTDLSTFFSNIIQGGSFTCIKVDTVPANAAGNSTIIRGCHFEKAPADDICKTLSVKAHGQSFLKFCEVCTADACNSADAIGRFSLLMFLPILGMLFYLRH